jgi:hypothetical protein
MAAPAEMPEFKGNVFAVRTAKFWDMRLKELEDKQTQGQTDGRVLEK